MKVKPKYLALVGSVIFCPPSFQGSEILSLSGKANFTEDKTNLCEIVGLEW
jgi:hypothetical protein